MKISKIIAVVLSLCFFFTACSGDEESGYFEGTRWGMSLAEVNETVDYLLKETNENLTYSAEAPEEVEIDYLEELGANILELNFDFKDDKLMAVRLTIEQEEGVMKDLVEDLCAHYDELYEVDEDNDTSTEKWITDTGSVSLFAFNSCVFITYEAENEEA